MVETMGPQGGTALLLLLLAGAVLLPRPAAAATPAPDFTIPLHNGTNFTLSQYRGQVVVLDFMFIGCGSCEIAEPGLKTVFSRFEAVSEYASKFEMVSISPYNAPSELADYRAQRTISWAIGSSLGANPVVDSLYSVTQYVTILVIDPNGYLVWRFTPQGIFTDSSQMAEDLTTAVRNSYHGIPSPDFTIPLVDGSSFNLSANRGKVVVLEFMFVGCVSCRTAESSLLSVHSTYRNNPETASRFEVLSVSANDTALELDAYRTDHALPWLFGADAALPARFNVPPNSTAVTLLVIDTNGYITWRFTPPPNWSDSAALATDLGATIQAAYPRAPSNAIDIQQLSIIVLIALAALSSFFSPCSFPLLPGYMTHYLQLEAKRYRHALATTARVEPQPTIQKDMAAKAIAAATQDLAMPGAPQELRVVLSAADRAFVAGEYVIALELAMMARGDLSRRAGIQAARENLQGNDTGDSLRRTEDLAREAEALNIPVPKTREILQLASAAFMAGDSARAAQLTAQALEELERERDAGIAAHLKTYEEAVAAAKKGGANTQPAQQALDRARQDLQAPPPKPMGLGKAALGGLAAGFGMVLIYGIVGAIVILAGAGAASTMPYVQPIVGVVLIALGFLTLTSRQFYFLSAAVEKFRARAFGNKEDDKDRYYSSLFAYGAGYGAAGFGCVAGPFVAASLQASAIGGIGLGVLAFLFYAVCVIILMVAITVILSAAGSKAVTKMNRYTDIIKKVSAVVLIAAGAYLVYFFWATRS